jgi:hypothetical protein
MAPAFDLAAIEGHGWRQGSVLGPGLLRAARDRAPVGIQVRDDDWLIVTSHDCDIANGALDKEPVVEVLRAEVTGRAAPDGQQIGGRNPRSLEIQELDAGRDVVLQCRVHERWILPRELLGSEGPARHLDRKNARLIAEWLAKRYIRAAFPTAFDTRWRRKMKEWLSILQKHSGWIQGVYLRLSTLNELEEANPYLCHLLVAVPVERKKDPEWSDRREKLEREVEAFWSQFAPGIQCAGVEVVPTDRLTLADIQRYQRFDADWVSFADDTEVIPPHGDMTA